MTNTILSSFFASTLNPNTRVKEYLRHQASDHTFDWCGYNDPTTLPTSYTIMITWSTTLIPRLTNNPQMTTTCRLMSTHGTTSTIMTPKTPKYTGITHVICNLGMLQLHILMVTIVYPSHVCMCIDNYSPHIYTHDEDYLRPDYTCDKVYLYYRYKQCWWLPLLVT